MKSLSVLVSALVLTACASKMGQIQESCEASTQTFQAMAACLKTQVTADPDMAAEPEVKLYLLKAEQLTEQVNEGKISQLDARVELQTLYVDLKNQESRKSSRSSSSGYTPPAKQTRCTTVNGKVNCATY